ncbi:MAG: tRNA (adenosine(37)-N6)-dimethylallyltransferase MiaA [bacterium]|nr:tRNA (adenosine(37)-N6)-dimethylallyltransferase MiaA [bacterium]
MKILVIVGPTAVGKSDLTVELALKFKGEVISADSRQIYEGLDIGTGKITKEEMRGIPHHLLSEVKPSRQFSVAEFKILAEQKIADIAERGKLPLVCGGTGFYIQALVDNLLLPEVLPDKTLRNELEKKTSQELFKILRDFDPKRAGLIDVKNKRRLIRAIEIIKALGKVPLLAKPETKFNPLIIGLDLPDDTLRKNISARISKRIKKGMIAEAEGLRKKGLTWKRMNELGLEYRYLAKLLREEISREEFIAVLEQKIWQYAKRQRTWFRRDGRIKWFEPSEVKNVIAVVSDFLSND